MVEPEKKSHIYCNLLQFSHYLRLGTRILIFFGAQSFDILIFRFIEYLEHTYWYQNDASKHVCVSGADFRPYCSSKTILCKIIDLSKTNVSLYYQEDSNVY